MYQPLAAALGRGRRTFAAERRVPMRDYGAIEDYQADELVVALPDRDIVRQALTGLHVATVTKDHDERLGLALLSLDEDKVAEAATELRRDAGLVDRATDAKWPRGA